MVSLQKCDSKVTRQASAGNRSPAQTHRKGVASISALGWSWFVAVLAEIVIQLAQFSSKVAGRWIGLALYRDAQSKIHSPGGM